MELIAVAARASTASDKDDPIREELAEGGGAAVQERSLAKDGLDGRRLAHARWRGLLGEA